MEKLILEKLKESIMAISSFNKQFVIDSKKAIESFLTSYETPTILNVSRKDIYAESLKGIELLKRKFSL